MTFHRPRLILVVWCFTCLLMVLRVLGAMGGWVGIKIFFRAILAVLRCSSRARCAAQAMVASVQYRGQASCRHRVLSFSVSPPLFLWSAAAFLRRQSGVFLHATASFFSRPHLPSCLISGLSTCSRCEWISSLLGSVPAFAPVELSVTILHIVL